MKYSNIGGQAVMEGVMMRNGEHYAVAVRTSDGSIQVKRADYRSLLPLKTVQKIPIVRGVFNFVDSLVLGMSSLMYSAEFFAEESEEEMEQRHAEEMKKAEKKAEKLRRQGSPEEADRILAAQKEKAVQERASLASAGAAGEKAEKNLGGWF